MTDNEREALERVLLTSFDYADIDPSVRELTDAILAAGFRRTEVPEPSAIINDGTDDAWQAIADALGNLGYDLNSHEDTAAWVQQYLFGSEQLGEPSDTIRATLDYIEVIGRDMPDDAALARVRSILKGERTS